MRRSLVLGMAVVGIAIAWFSRRHPSSEHRATTTVECTTDSDSASLDSSDTLITPVGADARTVAPPPTHAASGAHDIDTSRPLRIVGRLVDADRRPIEGGPVGVDVVTVPPAPEARVALDSDLELAQESGGRFHCDLRLPASTPGSFQFVVEYLGDDPVFELGLRGSVVITDTFAGEVDVGDLVLALPPVLAAGVVVDPDGNRIAALVSYAEPEGAPLPTFGPGRYHRTTTSDATGHFTLRGWSSAPFLTITAQHRSFDDASVDGIAPGTVDLTVRLRPSTRGSLDVQLTVDDTEMLRFLTVELTTERGVVGSDLNVLLNQGLCSFSGLPARAYGVRVRLRPLELTIATIEDLDVPARGTCADPRIHPLDLHGRFRWFRGTATRGAHTVGQYAHVPYRCVGGASGFLVSDVDGRWRFLVPVEVPTIEMVHADGTQEPLSDGMVVRVR